jgi:uncharacterized membrane protein (DUF106 family)
MKYSAADIARMKEEVRNLRALLAEAKNRGDGKEIRRLENEINGLENSITGRYN